MYLRTLTVIVVVAGAAVAAADLHSGGRAWTGVETRAWTGLKTRPYISETPGDAVAHGVAVPQGVAPGLQTWRTGAAGQAGRANQPPTPTIGPVDATGRPQGVDAGDWIQLFNGKDLKDWSPKFAHHALGENVNDTFRVVDGMLEVRYDKWNGFKDEFGHLFYKEPFSYYLLAAEYRFVGDQVKGAPEGLAWAIRNNGLMLHSPDPKTMTKDQDFPISIEVQLLGGFGKPRSTANLCTPGTNVVIGNRFVTAHCTNSKSKTYEGDQWVRVEVLVHGDELIRHIVDGETVLEYSRPQMGGGQASPTDPSVFIEGTAMPGGFISLQAETAPIDFRKVELLNLEGCMDPKSKAYRPYHLKPKAGACK